MLDVKNAEADAEATVETYDLAVIGAGIAGLNALNCGVEYLPKGARVILIDEKEQPGGMWNTAYDYVRLHQPHPMFTVGDMKWDWTKPRHYLAARDEVRSHLARSLDPIAKHAALTTAFGTTATSCDEVETADGPMAEITCRSSDGTARRLRAVRAIHASGLNYRLAKPLEFSSGDVLSIIPQDLLSTLAQNPSAPVFVVGGGKTGMDTILATLAADPKRKVTLINGRGTNFLNRTRYIPTGLRRWTSGALVSRLFRDLALHFDGDNEDEMIDYFRRTHSSNPASRNGVFLYGLQSEDEQVRIEKGLTRTHADYLEDVVDADEGPELRLRGGKSITIPAGAVFVNCCGSFFRDDEMTRPRPFLTKNQRVMSINPRCSMHFLTSVAGFFGTHLLYRGELAGRGLYTLDHEALFRKNRNAWVGAAAAQAYMNQVISVQTMPLKLLDRCGLDLDRWYPLPRRMAGLMRMKSTAKDDIAHCRRILDRTAERFGVHAEAV